MAARRTYVSLTERGFTLGIITDTTHPSFEGLSRLLIKDVPGFLSDVGLHRAQYTPFN